MAKAKPKANLMERQFLSLEDAAALFNRKEEELMAYVDSGIIPSSTYCYPVHFGDGKKIAFLPKELEKAIAGVPKEEKPKTKKSKK